jgi:hypothetical protein
MVAAEVLEIEMDGPRNENPIFRPLQKRLRGRFDLMRVAEPQSRMLMEKLPKPIPGQRLGLNMATREGYLLEPLHLPEYAEIKQSVCEPDGTRACSLPEPREVFPEVDLATWLYWMAAEVKNGTAKITIGKLPANVEGKVVATMNNSAKPGVILTAGRLPPGPGDTGPGQRPVLTPEQRNQLLNSIKTAYGSYLKFGNTAIIDGLIEAITPFSSAVTDVDYQGGSKLAKSRILQSFGVHEFIVGESAPSSYAQAAAVERVFCDNVINPVLILMGQVLTGWMAPKFQAPGGAKLKVWFEPARARDDDLDFKRWQLGANRNFVTPNEYRIAMLGLPAIEGGDELPSAPPATDVSAPSIKAMIARLGNPYQRNTALLPAGVNGNGRH